ncbi:MAG: hypothetical protein U0325_25830 [Polyangiales bacterium]
MEPVKLDDLAASLTRRGAPLTPESATFITLECVEALSHAPRVLSPDGVLVAPDGVVSLVEEALSPALDEAEVLRGALELLEGLVLAPSASVMDLAARVREGSVQGRAALVAELTALLVPFNRSAARRMLGRLVREHQRALTEPATLSEPRDEGPASAADEASADATWLDRPGGPLAHAADETDPGERLVTRKDPAATKGLAMLLLSAVALAGAAWFLWSRL